MASKVELAKLYMELQSEQKTDEMLTMMSDDVSMTNPMTGTTTGKEALAEQMRNRPMGGGGMTIDWSEPEEDGDGVKILGAGSPFGTIKLVLSFNGDDEINKIEAGLA